MSVISNKPLPDISRLEPLDGTNYKRWSQKLFIFFEQLEVDYVLFHELPVDVITCASDRSVLIDPATPIVTPLTMKMKQVDEETRRKHEKDNRTVRGHLLNHMTNSLFDLFVSQKSAKVIWDTLEKRYGADDAGMKKYVVGKWLQFRMVDDKPVMEQVHVYENLVTDVLNEGMEMCKTL